MDWSKLLTVEDLPESYRAVAELIGLDNTLKLAETFPGRPLYFANPRKLFMPKIKEYVRTNFNRHNHLSLSVQTGLTVRTIYKIVETRDGDEDADGWKEGELF